jgi:NAD(P)-dependent dehydrogenase (short-subunit alcohol dehydrogenase family)
VMREQPSGGHIFNMDGAGADGGATPRFAAYGATKRGLAQLGKSLQVGRRCEFAVKLRVAAASTITIATASSATPLLQPTPGPCCTRKTPHNSTTPLSAAG